MYAQYFIDGCFGLFTWLLRNHMHDCYQATSYSRIYVCGKMEKVCCTFDIFQSTCSYILFRGTIGLFVFAFYFLVWRIFVILKWCILMWMSCLKPDFKVKLSNCSASKHYQSTQDNRITFFINHYNKDNNNYFFQEKKW